jgi:hypothetical protein
MAKIFKHSSTKVMLGVAVVSLLVQAGSSVLDYNREDPAARLSKYLGAQMQTLSEAQDQRTNRLIEAFQTFYRSNLRKIAVHLLRRCYSRSCQLP